MEQLEVRALGGAEVLVGGREAEWHAAAARDLFFYLLSHPEGRSKEDVLETLWDLEGSPAANNRFRVTVHRVRAALGSPDTVLEERGRYRLGPAVFAASDVHRLHESLDQAASAEDSDVRLAAIQRALAAYGGEYLAGERAEWASAAREEHRAAYARAAIELSLLYCDDRSCTEAVGALVRALRADPYLGENYHQKLMTCLSVVEGKYAAVEHYRRFLRFLRDELDDTPMAETVGLAERIKAGEPICRAHGGPDPMPTLSCPLTPDGRCRSVPASTN